MTFSAWLESLSWRMQDELRHSKTLRTLNGWRLWGQSYLAQPTQAAERICRALGFSESPLLDGLLCRRLTEESRFPLHPEFWAPVVGNNPRYRKLLKQEPALSRSVLAKAPGPNGEKGVILMLFEYNWARIGVCIPPEEFRWLDQHYDLILCTSWSPTDYAALALILSLTTGPVFVQSCNFKEAPKLRRFHPRVAVLDILGCDWINPVYYPSPAIPMQRPIDFVMVANWGEFKRHRDFFLALRHLPADLRIVLIGQKEGGRDADYIQNLAKRWGVPQQLEIHQSLQIDQVSEIQSQAKVSLILSRREGYCGAVTESLFAGCAVGMRADAHVGPLDYINDQTGLRLRPDRLAEDLHRLLKLSCTLQPAVWAAQHISCHISTGKLNATLKESCLARGLPWTADMAPVHWRPYPRLQHPEDVQRLAPAAAECHRRFPQVFPPDFAQ